MAAIFAATRHQDLLANCFRRNLVPVVAREFMTVTDAQVTEYIRYLDRGTTPGIVLKEKIDLTPLTEILPGPVEGVDLRLSQKWFPSYY